MTSTLLCRYSQYTRREKVENWRKEKDRIAKTTVRCVRFDLCMICRFIPDWNPYSDGGLGIFHDHFLILINCDTKYIFCKFWGFRILIWIIFRSFAYFIKCHKVFFSEVTLWSIYWFLCSLVDLFIYSSVSFHSLIH